MKRILYLSAAVLAILVLAGCYLQNPLASLSQEDDNGGLSSFSLPADSINDTSRSLTGEFRFETLLPVDLNIKINLYDPNALADGASPLLPEALVPVMVILEDTEGNPVYSGMTDKNGTFKARIKLPAAPEDMVIRLRAEGFEERTIVISDLVQYSGINRTMGMEIPFTNDSAVQSRILSGSEDTDGDGVPDIYDADPDDPNTSFINNFPANGQMTVAFEDLFGMAWAGDADYNDFIARYQITERSVSDGITGIRVDAEAVEKLAGYRHRFGIRINSFNGTATLEGRYISTYGSEVPLYVEGVTAPVEIDLFKDSRYAVGKTAWFTLTFDQEQQQGDDIEMGLDDAPYNPYLYIITTGHDVHLIGEEPLNGSINPGDTFRDGKGFPWALLVPAVWVHPEETERIETPYPRFTLWRESGGEEHSDWYNHYYDPWIPPDDNNPPAAAFPQGDYQVFGAGSASVNGYYEESGTLNGRPLYTQTGGGVNKLFFKYFSGHPFPPPAGNFWCIDSDETTGAILDLDYWKYGTADLPALTGWSAGSGITPVPTLKTIPISGATTLGGTLTVEYIFSDPDGDGEGTTTFRWLRCDTPGGPGVIITGATGVSYTSTADDSGKYLKAEVTPVDDRGGVGLPVVSEASGQIGS